MANNSKSVLEEVEDFEKVVEAPPAQVFSWRYSLRYRP